MQEVEYENIPSYCSICKHLGHDVKVCKSSKNPVRAENSEVRPLILEVSDSAGQQTSRPDSAGQATSIPTVSLPPEFDSCVKRRFKLNGQPRFRKLRLTIERELV
ncbi:hypothetical protein OROMI_028875 [Orobanche minor]